MACRRIRLFFGAIRVAVDGVLDVVTLLPAAVEAEELVELLEGGLFSAVDEDLDVVSSAAFCRIWSDFVLPSASSPGFSAEIRRLPGAPVFNIRNVV